MTLLSKKIENRGSGKKKDPNEIKASEYKEPIPPDGRRRGKRRGPLRLHDKVNIIHEVVCQYIPTKEVARKYRVSDSYVALLTSIAKNKPRFMEQLHEKEMENDALMERIKKSLKDRSTAGTVFQNVDQIQKALKDDVEMEFKTPYLLKILHEEIKGKYKKIKAVSWRGNTVKNLLLRQ